MKKVFALAIFLVATIFVVPFSVEAAIDVQGTDLEIILDCSGSMAGMIGGQSKMDIAKKSLENVINQIPEGSYVGFRAYGHQSDKSLKDCTDSQLIYPIGPINRSQLISKIDSLSPRGWTPIGYSLAEAQKDFSAKSEYGKMIVLVSDGEETCGGDPCAKVKELKAAGFDVTINTVGFDVGDIAEKELKCIAETTGGEYKSAKNANELTESLRFFSTRAFEDFTTSGGAKAGTGFVNAPVVEAGDYGGDILMGESKFYKFNAKKGQEVIAVASVRRESATTASIGCTCMQPGIKVFDKYKKEVASQVAEGCAKFYDVEGIDGDDLSPSSYDVQFTAEKTGEFYLSISGSWDSECDPNMIDYWKEKLKTRTPKAFYELTLGIEGDGVDDVTASTSKTTESDEMVGDDLGVAGNIQDQKAESGSSNMLLIVVLIVGIILIIVLIVVIILLLRRKNSKDVMVDGSTSFVQKQQQNQPINQQQNQQVDQVLDDHDK